MLVPKARSFQNGWAFLLASTGCQWGYLLGLTGAPHTNNWDLPSTLMVAFALRLSIYWMGKEQLFKPPLRGLMMWLGAFRWRGVSQFGNLPMAGCLKADGYKKTAVC